jgi:hypothetical protein
LTSKSPKIQIIIPYLLIVANFIAQIPYFIHQYYDPHHPFAQIKGILLMSGVLAFFILASVLLFRRQRPGYILMVIFLSVEFLFYLWTTLAEPLHGYGWFFHLYAQDEDLVLKTVFAIGYVNLFAAGYLLGLLLFKRSHQREQDCSRRKDLSK